MQPTIDSSQAAADRSCRGDISRADDRSQLASSPIKTAYSVLVISMATAALIISSYTQDEVDFIMNFQLSRVQRSDIDVVLGDHAGGSEASTIRDLPAC